MKLLHVDSSITGENSVSRQVSAKAVAALVAANPAIVVTTRDLVNAPLPAFTLAAMPMPDGTPSAEQAQTLAILDEFLDSDIVVLGAAMYNFGIPGQLKAWIDRLLIAGKTFQYTAEGPQGLAGAKRVVVALARGGLYAGESPFAPAEHCETYLRVVLGFIGIDAPEFIIVEGIALGADQRTEGLATGLAAAAALT